MSYTIPQIPATATSIGTTDLLELAVAGATSAQISWASVLGTAQSWTAAQTVKVADAATATVTNVIVVSHDSSGTPAASFGTGIKFQGQDSTTADTDMAVIQSVWLVATHASRSSQIQFQTVSNAGALSITAIIDSVGTIYSGSSTSASLSLSSGGAIAKNGSDGIFFRTSATAGSGGTIAFQLSGGVASVPLAAQMGWANNGITPADTGLARSSAGVVKLTNGLSGVGNLVLGTVTSYNSVSTAGIGVPAVYAAGRTVAAIAAVASVAAYTVGAADGSFEISANVNITAATTATIAVTVTYTDEGNTSRTQTLSFTQLNGTILSSITNVTGIGPYAGLTNQIRCKAGTTITVATSGTFTSVAYNVEATIKQTS